MGGNRHGINSCITQPRGLVSRAPGNSPTDKFLSFVSHSWTTTCNVHLDSTTGAILNLYCDQPQDLWLHETVRSPTPQTLKVPFRHTKWYSDWLLTHVKQSDLKSHICFPRAACSASLIRFSADWQPWHKVSSKSGIWRWRSSHSEQCDFWLALRTVISESSRSKLQFLTVFTLKTVWFLTVLTQCDLWQS